MLFRKIESLIENHFRSGSKEILLVDGARQVGKTYIIRHVAQNMLENFIEINMIEDSPRRSSVCRDKNCGGFLSAGQYACGRADAEERKHIDFYR